MIISSPHEEKGVPLGEKPFNMAARCVRTSRARTRIRNCKLFSSENDCSASDRILSPFLFSLPPL